MPAVTVADLIAKRNRTENNVPEPPTPTNICFSFEIQRIDGCADEFLSTLDKKVIIKTQPPIDQKILDKIK